MDTSTVPVVFRSGAFRFFFYSNEGSPREPVHIHVDASPGEAKFWLRPQVQIAYNDGFDRRALRELRQLIEANRDRIETAWEQFFGESDERTF